ncbi:MAG: sodium/proline symporter [Bacteroidetes bacterium]|nr:sodium/proline symporter [Bacteroidota bacterium]
MNINLIPIIIILIIYSFIIYSISIFASKRSKSISDYILGDRNLNGFTTAMSAGASDMSSWLLTALPGLVYLNGFSTIWMPISLTIGAFLNWVLVSKRLRIFSEKFNNSLTIPQYLSNRFGNKGNSLRLITSLILIFFLTFYAVAGFVSAAKLTQITFNFDYKVSLILSAIFIVTYTAIGGFLAVSWVDVFQGILMFFSLLIVPFIAYKNINNFSEKIQEIISNSPNYFNLFQGITYGGIISLFAWGLGYVGQPHIIGRFMAIKSTKQLPLARNICTFWMFIAMICAFLVGIIGNVYYKLQPLEDPESVFLKISQVFFNPWLNGILLCAVISSIMSTVSALILMSANSLIEIFLKILKKNKINNKKHIWMNRIGIIFISSISVFIASDPNLTIMQSVAFPWCGLGASFGPVIIMSLYWSKMTYNGAVAGILSGGIFVIIWELLVKFQFSFIDKFKLLPGFCLLPAFTMSIFFIYIISLMDKKNKDIIKTYEIIEKVNDI